MRAISHDAFGRFTIYRETVFTAHATAKTCEFCGNVKKTPKGTPYLYKYYVEDDGITSRKIPLKGLFCSIECARSYGSLS